MRTSNVPNAASLRRRVVTLLPGEIASPSGALMRGLGVKHWLCVRRPEHIGCIVRADGPAPTVHTHVEPIWAYESAPMPVLRCDFHSIPILPQTVHLQRGEMPAAPTVCLPPEEAGERSHLLGPMPGQPAKMAATASALHEGYRQARRSGADETSSGSTAVSNPDQKQNQVKNNLASSLNPLVAKISVIAAARVKNILARVEIIVIDGLPQKWVREDA